MYTRWYSIYYMHTLYVYYRVYLLYDIHMYTTYYHILCPYYSVYVLYSMYMYVVYIILSSMLMYTIQYIIYNNYAV